MSENATARDIANEKANERHYRNAIEGRGAADLSTIAMPRNTQATGTGLLSSGLRLEGELQGRVQVAVGSSGLDCSNFYIGPSRASCRLLGFDEEDPARWEVFSWAAPVAAAFYTGHYSGKGVEVSAGVVRTIVRSSSKGMELADDNLLEPVLPVFPVKQMQVPQPPTVPSESASGEGTGVVSSSRVRKKRVEPDAAEKPDAITGDSEVRGRKVLEVVMSAPRKEQLDAQLATLQKRQYELISQSSNRDQLIQGNPGTGKTIVAAHRVAYLLDPESLENGLPSGKVMLVGPSIAYTRHVSKILFDLVPPENRSRYVLTSVEEMFRGLMHNVPLESFKTDHPPRNAHSFDRLLFEVAGLAAENFKDDYEVRFFDSLSGSTKKANIVPPLKELSAATLAKRCYEYFREPANAMNVIAEVIRRGIHDDEATEDEIEESVALKSASWNSWVDSLPPFDELSDLPDQQWLIALMAWHLDLEVDHDIFRDIRHVIVDEAQDIYPVEWEFIQNLNLNGHWTVLGDFNQQSAVHESSNWNQISRMLGLRMSPQMLELGYRSTSGIMALANSVIGKSAVSGNSIQISSEMPRHKHIARRADLPAAIEEALEAFAQSYPGGMYAVICPPTMISLFRKVFTQRGWWQEDDFLRWRHPKKGWTNNVSVTLGSPQELRGLEYDAVALVEPAEIKSVQQQFMAITRANQELVIIASGKLPLKIHNFIRPE